MVCDDRAKPCRKGSQPEQAKYKIIYHRTGSQRQRINNQWQGKNYPTNWKPSNASRRNS
jgi:hypothetical protein